VPAQGLFAFLMVVVHAMHNLFFSYHNEEKQLFFFFSFLMSKEKK